MLSVRQLVSNLKEFLLWEKRFKLDCRRISKDKMIYHREQVEKFLHELENECVKQGSFTVFAKLDDELTETLKNGVKN